MVSVRLFAVAREIVGADSVDVHVAPGATAREVFQALVKSAPELERVVALSILAIDGEPASDNTRIPSSAEVALIPPVSGG
jgi:molybdopterin synthase catalytic subunit/molybdopterin synthase sulfur carrier subunit